MLRPGGKTVLRAVAGGLTTLPLDGAENVVFFRYHCILKTEYLPRQARAGTNRGENSHKTIDGRFSQAMTSGSQSLAEAWLRRRAKC